MGKIVKTTNQVAYKQGHKSKDAGSRKKKNTYGIPMSVLNMMNAVLGSGILGLANAVSNVGIVLFMVFLVGTAFIAFTSIALLLEISEHTKCVSYEKIGKYAFGRIGKLITAFCILIQCLGACCSYLFIVKYNLPGVIRSLAGFSNCFDPWYLNGDYLVILVTVVVVVPLASLKNIGKLSYTSGFAQACMVFFTVMVVAKKFYVPCPILGNPLATSSNYNLNYTTEYDQQANLTMEKRYNIKEECNVTLSHDAVLDEMKSSLKTQKCKVDAFNWNSNSVYAVPTMIFSFQCHSSVLHIYSDLKKPTVGRMKTVAGITMLFCMVSYSMAAIFGYLTFYNATGPELLFMYSAHHPNNIIVVIARLMVILMAIFTVPLTHFPARNALKEIFFGKKPFSWARHLSLMVILLTATDLLVIYLPSIRDVFGIVGASAATTLMIILPSLFYIKLIPHQGISPKRIIAFLFVIFGFLFMGYSMALMIRKWIKN